MSSETLDHRVTDTRSQPHGTLVLIVGPSGAGKDTVMRLAAARLAPDSGIMFPRRIITRPPDESEANDELDETAFVATEKAGGFALVWRAHGLCYALPGDLVAALAAGRSAVVNVSRRVIDDAHARFVNVRVVTITAAPHILAARLAARGRDIDAASRLKRTVPPLQTMASTCVIQNEAAPEAAADRLVAFLREIVSG